MNYQLANQIVDTLIIYTEAMAFYALLAMLVLHVDHYCDKYCKQSNLVTNKQQLLTAAEEQKQLPAARLHHNFVPFTRTQQNKYLLMTCGQLRSYLRDHGYTKLNKLRKHELVSLCEVV